MACSPPPGLRRWNTGTKRDSSRTVGAECMRAVPYHVWAGRTQFEIARPAAAPANAGECRRRRWGKQDRCPLSSTAVASLRACYAG
eukprot:7160267-Alexandrium_andersonii.AAC.1